MLYHIESELQSIDSFSKPHFVFRIMQHKEEIEMNSKLSLNCQFRRKCTAFSENDERNEFLLSFCSYYLKVPNI